MTGASVKGASICRKRRRRALLCLLPALCLSGHGQAAAVLDGRTLRSEDGARVVWQREFPPAAGDLTGPLEVGGVTYLGTGPAVYAYGPGGEVLGRADLPGVVTSLEASGDAVRVSTREAGYSERFTLTREGGLTVQERAVPPPDPAITGWLARVADAVPVPELDRAAQDDPSNPFLALRQAAQPGDAYTRLSEVRRALNANLTFPAWVQLAARLDAAGFPVAADLALDRARRDAAARGLDPQVPVSRATLAAYGNPSGYVGTLLSQNRLARADVWMRHLRQLHPRFEGGPALYARYAALLDAQGREGEAEDWRAFVDELRGGTLYNLGPEGTRSVRDAARLAAMTLLLSLLAALLTLSARAWRRQGEDLRAQGGRWGSWLRHPLSRARRTAVAYASAPERLTLTLLCAALFAALGGWQWSNQARADLSAPALTTGTYGGGWAGARLNDLNLRPGPDAALLAGLAAQLDGDTGQAREQYTRALPDACALNNLGVIAQGREDNPQAREQYRAALATRPDLSAAAFNLGLKPAAPELDFQRTYRPGEPRLCYPDQRSLTRALTGDLSTTLGRALRQPLALIRPADPGGRPAGRLGWAILGALLWAALLAVSLLLPRAATPAQLGRPAGYRLLAFALPGTGLLEIAWGAVLLLLWAGALAALVASAGVGGAAPFLAFPHLTVLGGAGARASLLTLLGVTYAVNTLVLLTAEVRHARRARQEAGA